MGSSSFSLSPSASRTPNSGRKRPTACPPASPGRPPPCPVAAAARAGRKALSRSICSGGVGLDLAYLLDQHPPIEIQASRSADTPSPCESNPSRLISLQRVGLDPTYPFAASRPIRILRSGLDLDRNRSQPPDPDPRAEICAYPFG
jgi:hypothetical protein